MSKTTTFSTTCQDLIVSPFMAYDCKAIPSPYHDDSIVAAAVPAHEWDYLHSPDGIELLESLGIDTSDDRIIYALAHYIDIKGVDDEDIDGRFIDAFRGDFVGRVNLRRWLEDDFYESLIYRGVAKDTADYMMAYFDEVTYMLTSCGEGYITAIFPFTGLTADNFDYEKGGFSLAGGRAHLESADLDRDFLVFFNVEH